jgi:hypothetical protein
MQTKLHVLETKWKKESVNEELGSSIGRNFKCKECDHKFGSNEILRSHIPHCSWKEK